MKGESRISSIGALFWHSAGRPSGPSRPPQEPPVHSGVGMAKGNRSPGYLVFGSIASALSSALAISAISAISVIDFICFVFPSVGGIGNTQGRSPSRR